MAITYTVLYFSFNATTHSKNIEISISPPTLSYKSSMARKNEECRHTTYLYISSNISAASIFNVDRLVTKASI